MNLISNDPDFDPVEAQNRASRWEDVRIRMKLGALTPDNIWFDDRMAVREFFERLPLIEPTGDSEDSVRVVGQANLVEGRDWCFATSQDGTFGVFTLDEPSRTFLTGAVFHLWVTDSEHDPHDVGRVDFTSLAEYQDEALEALLAA